MRDLRDHLHAHDRDARVGEAVGRALRVLSSFTLTYGPSVKLDLRSEPGRGDTGDLATDLGDVLVDTCRAARGVGTVVVVTIDEVQKLPAAQLEAVLSAVQRLYRDREDPEHVLPLALVGAGLPTALDVIRDLGGTFGERVRVHPLGLLTRAETVDAMATPTRQRGITWESEGLSSLARRSGGWPVAVQQYAYEAWNAGRGERITVADVETAITPGAVALDRIYASRLRGVTDRQRAYLAAMAALPGSQRTSSAVAERLGGTSAGFGSTRDGLIRAGLIRPDGYGRAAFTVPGLSDFLRRGGDPETADGRT